MFGLNQGDGAYSRYVTKIAVFDDHLECCWSTISVSMNISTY